MADVPGHELPYGHFGAATYETTGKDWKFLRRRGDGAGLVLVGEPESATSASRLVSQSIKPPNSSTVRRHADQIKHLVKAAPHVHPATDILSPLLRVSEAIIAATTQHDALQGTALAFSSIPSEERHLSIPVAAFMSDLSKQTLQIHVVRTERRGWDDTKYAWLEIPMVGGLESTWHSDAGPIQQVHFSQALDRGTSTVESAVFMAVRCLAKTFVFRPIFRKERNSDRDGCLTPSLDLCPAFAISIAETNGQSHADVAFNPWFPRQFAIIDVSGDWEVWDLGSRRSQAQASRAYRKSNPKDRMLSAVDGWARVLWVGGPTTVVVCTRRTLKIFDIASGEQSSVNVADVTRLTPASSILDMKMLPTHSAHFCVLTSTHVTIVHVRQGIELDATSLESVVVMKLTHFWSPHDLSLTLAVAADGDEGESSLETLISNTDIADIVILLGSTSAAPIVSYRVRVDEDYCTMVRDPSTVIDPAINHHIHGILSMSLSCVNYGDRGSRWRAERQQSVATDLNASDVRFFYLTVLRSDGTVTQSLCADRAYATGLGILTAPTWKVSPHTRSALRLGKEGFVVDDDDEEVLLDFGCEARQRPIPPQHRRKQGSSATCRIGAVRTINHEHAAKRIDSQAMNDSKSISQVMDLVASLLQQDQGDLAPTLTTLRELGNEDEISVEDVGSASARLRSLARCKPAEPLDTGPASTDQGNAAQLQTQSLTWSYELQEIYQHMIGDWISPLSAQVPGRLRLVKETMLRNAASEVALATKLLGPRTLVDQPDDPETPKAEHSFMELGSSAHPQQTSVLPTPSPTATPSVTTAASQLSTMTTSAEFGRLGRYTKFTPSLTSCLLLSSPPRSLANVLDHWALGADPQEYDWVASSRHVAVRRHEEEDEELGEKERAYARKKAERYMKRQRREADQMERRRLQNSQATSVMSSQLPERPRGFGESRSMASGSQDQAQDPRPAAPAASQVVAGKYGGRLNRPPVRKKRKQGF